MARKHLASLARVPDARAAGVSGARRESLEKIRSEFGVEVFRDREELFERCDAVDICLPTFLHCEAAAAAAAAGRHVLCEKPLAMSVAEAEEIIRACGEAGVLLMTAHCLRFWPEYMFLEESAGGGEHGALLELSCRRFGGFPGWASGGWLGDAEKSGGPAVDLHIHDADFIAHVAGLPAAVRSGEVRTENVWSVFSEFVYEDGPRARAEAGWFLKEGYTFRQGYRAVFESAVIEFSSDRAEAPLVIYREGAVPELPVPPPGDAYVRQLEYFTDCVLSGRWPERSDGRAGLEALRLALAARESARLGEPVILIK